MGIPFGRFVGGVCYRRRDKAGVKDGRWKGSDPVRTDRVRVSR